MDSGSEIHWLTASATNLALLGLFALQHSVMARPSFKKWWTAIIPEVIERSTYVMATNVVLVALIYFWQPVNIVIWNLSGESYVPFIWEVDNREAFKTVGDVFVKLSKMKRLPVNHTVYASSEERKLPNGNSYYVPSTRLDLTKKVETSDKDQELFGDLLSWVTNYNQYIMGQFDENVHSKEDIDPAVVETFIDITSDEKVQ